jgi:tellurite resistance protein TehA-like permease
VLGTRLTLLGWSWAGIALLVVAVLTWLALLAGVLRNWATPTTGISLMLTVSAQSLAVLCAVLAAREQVQGLIGVAFVFFVFGLVAYAFVFARFDMRELASGRGDHWITGGALGISALAAGEMALANASLVGPNGLQTLLKDGALILWALTIVWLPALAASEALRPRLRYDARRWGTVFPVGMYAACSFVVGEAANASALTHFARVWVWVAVGVWLVILVATIHRGARLVAEPDDDR